MSGSSPSVIAKRASPLMRRLKIGALKRLYKYYTPTAINLAGGLPMESTFPFDSVSYTLAGTDAPAARLRLADKSLNLQYHRGDGLPDLKSWISAHVSSVHAKNTANCVTVGSTDALNKTLSLLDGDCFICDEFAYGAAVSTGEALGRRCLGVRGDAEGMLPDALRETVVRGRAAGLNPDVVYLVPVGHNPTGTSMSERRKAEIYRVCQELDIIVVEDDAYYYLHYGEGTAAAASDLPGTRSLPKSFLSLDTDGRVIRFDSLSKVISPGMRVGWVSAPQDFIDKFVLLQEITTQFPCGVSQSIFLSLVRQWGEEGIHSHFQKVQKHYLDQRDVLCSALSTKFTGGKLSFTQPTAGMFLWVKVNGASKTSDEMFEQLASSGVVTVSGDAFRVPNEFATSQGPEGRGPFLRLSFANAAPASMQAAVQRMSEILAL